MFKYSVLFLVSSTILFLGLAIPGPVLLGPRLDPVPAELKVAHSSHCAGCHGRDETGNSLVDADGNDVNIHDDWQISMMGLSAHDPFWRATLSLETTLFPEAKEDIEETCLRCHAPQGSAHSEFSGLTYSFEKMLTDSLGLDGVSCGSCHQQPSKDLGKGHSGFFQIDTNRVFFGPYPNPFQGPMQIYVGFDPVFSDHIYSSGICAGCHTLITETLTEEGLPTGNFFVEQATYHEWLNSIYPGQGKECQTCHLPFIQDSVVIATDLQALKKRHPYGLHQFFGANTAMLSLMRENKELLDLPVASGEQAWEESISSNRTSLSKAATVEIIDWIVFQDSLYINVSIKNKSGHKMPSGYPSRIAWLQVTLLGDVTNDTIYANGMMDEAGNIYGRDFPFEPHHTVSKSEGDVQIYEMVMSDIGGHLTTRLNSAYQPMKDNRLLPLGFRRDHGAYDTVAIWGSATDDIQYDQESHKGEDLIEYRIPLNGNKGLADLNVAFQYHTFPARWMDDLFLHDSIAFVQQFKSMYAGYENFTELIDEASLEDIDLSPASLSEDFSDFQFLVFPNPGKQLIHFQVNDKLSSKLDFELITPAGKVIYRNSVSSTVVLPGFVQPGLYYIVLKKGQKVLGLKPFVHL